jgi:hypothetical protein
LSRSFPLLELMRLVLLPFPLDRCLCLLDTVKEGSLVSIVPRRSPSPLQPFSRNFPSSNSFRPQIGSSVRGKPCVSAVLILNHLLDTLELTLLSFGQSSSLSPPFSLFPLLQTPSLRLKTMSTAPSGLCAVCGVTTNHRCSSCADFGTDVFLCSREHQKVVSFALNLEPMSRLSSLPPPFQVWFAHKLVCGANSKPFRLPLLSADEVEEMIRRKDDKSAPTSASISDLVCTLFGIGAQHTPVRNVACEQCVRFH